MLNRYVTKPLLSLIVGGCCLSLSPSHDYNTNNSSSNQEIRPGVSDDSSHTQRSSDQSSSQSKDSSSQVDNREMNQWTDREEPISRNKANLAKKTRRMGSWDYKGNWRYNRESFYKGETQVQAYRKMYPTGAGGAGYDADSNYLKHQHEIAKAEKERQSKQSNHSNSTYKYADSHTNQSNQNHPSSNTNANQQTNLNPHHNYPNAHANATNNQVNQNNSFSNHDSNRQSNLNPHHNYPNAHANATNNQVNQNNSFSNHDSNRQSNLNSHDSYSTAYTDPMKQNHSFVYEQTYSHSDQNQGQYYPNHERNEWSYPSYYHNEVISDRSVEFSYPNSNQY